MTIKSPAPARIRAARETAGLTQSAAGALVNAALRTWQQWEAGDRAMPATAWELFLLRADLHPDSRIVVRK